MSGAPKDQHLPTSHTVRNPQVLPFSSSPNLPDVSASHNSHGQTTSPPAGPEPVFGLVLAANNPWVCPTKAIPGLVLLVLCRLKGDGERRGSRLRWDMLNQSLQVLAREQEALREPWPLGVRSCRGCGPTGLRVLPHPPLHWDIRKSDDQAFILHVTPSCSGHTDRAFYRSGPESLPVETPGIGARLRFASFLK